MPHRSDWISLQDGSRPEWRRKLLEPRRVRGTKLVVRGCADICLQAGSGAIRSKSVDVLEVEYTPSNVRWWYQLRGLFCSRLPGMNSAWGDHRMNWKILGEAGSGYTDTIINALIQAAEGSARNAHATAALESAAGLYQAAFSAAKVEPESRSARPLFPWGSGKKRLIRYGQAVYLIGVEDGRIRLRDVASWNIGGGPNEDRLDL